jgi:hypothetical protein
MITVVTPFQRRQNIDLIANALKGKANWVVLIDDPQLATMFPDWVTVKGYNMPPKVDPLFWSAFIPSNRLFNCFIDGGLDDETQYMVLCDDDSIEEGFFDKIPDDDVVLVSMKRGDNVVQGYYCAYPTNTLVAHPDNVKIASVAGEQMIVKGKVLKNYRYGASAVGDGECVLQIVKDHPVTYVPDAFVLFNYYEKGRFNSFKPKPIVLFIGDYYCAANPRMGLSEWEGNIWASLESTGLVDVARFHMDKYFYHTNKRGDEALLDRLATIKPDYVVLILYKPLSSDPTVISLQTLQQIALYSKIPIISIWGDLEILEQRELSKQIAPFAWKMIGTANKAIVESLGYTYMHVPKDGRVFNNPNKQRDIDVVFSGSYGYGREDRAKVLQYLLDNKVNLVHGGSEGGEHLTVESYADRYQRAKMAISFSQCGGHNVVNARPFEVMSCGALLLEQKSEELAKLYTPGVDYVEWINEVDLLEKIRYYLTHEEERLLISNNGQKKTEQLYSAKTFWDKTLNV